VYASDATISELQHDKYYLMKTKIEENENNIAKLLRNEVSHNAGDIRRI